MLYTYIWNCIILKIKCITAVSFHQYLLSQRQGGWPGLTDMAAEAARPHWQGRLHQSRDVHIQTYTIYFSVGTTAVIQPLDSKESPSFISLGFRSGLAVHPYASCVVHMNNWAKTSWRQLKIGLWSWKQIPICLRTALDGYQSVSLTSYVLKSNALWYRNTHYWRWLCWNTFFPQVPFAWLLLSVSLS